MPLVEMIRQGLMDEQKSSMVEFVEPTAYLVTPVEHLLYYPKIIEMAGRTCYKSEGNIKEDSAEKFIRSILKRGHESVIEHCVISYRIVCDRSCSHQLVRHRLAAYSQESMRYCDYSNTGKFDKLQVVIPPSIARIPAARERYLRGCERDYDDYKFFRDLGVPPEDARFKLPTGTKTEVFTTFNLRQWRHVFTERALNPHAQWEIKNIFLGILYELNNYLPVFFEDLVNVLAERKNALTSS